MQPEEDWERLLLAAARLQSILPGAVLVGGTSAAVHAGHRRSIDADHVLRDLRDRFDEILAELESVAGRETARVRRPVLILGNLDGLETGVRQLIREEPLETESIRVANGTLTIPVRAEILRIKAVLILKRNATRDYVDFAVLSAAMTDREITDAFASFDRLYPQPSGESATQQLIVQLAKPMPFDLESDDLSELRQLKPHWRNWRTVTGACAKVSRTLFRGKKAGDAG